MTRSALVAALLGTAIVVAGCSNSSAGQALPTGGRSAAETSASTQRSGTSASPLPARPREIRLDGKDPCTLVPESDWPKFHIEKPGRFRQQDPVSKSPDCLYTHAFALSITLVITEGIGKWTDGSRSGIAEKVDPVDGFPAISITRKDDKYDCYIAVDVADGQYLLAIVNLTPNTAPQVPERCEYAHQLAESAMRTLVKS